MNTSAEPSPISALRRSRRRRRQAVAGGAAIVIGLSGLGFAAVSRSAAPAGSSVPGASSASAAVLDWTPDERAAIARLAGGGGPPPPSPTNRFADDPAAVDLGHRLFYDRRFARGVSMGCMTCHIPAEGFAERRRLPEGTLPGQRHSPTILDVAHQRWYFWDGRTDSLWSQALDPFEDLKEYASTRVDVVRRLASLDDLAPAYEAAFGPLPPDDVIARWPADATPDRANGHPQREAWAAMDLADQEVVNRTFANIGKSLEAFERRIVTGPSPFDRYAASIAAGGNGGRHLTPAAQRGLRLFIGRADCIACHTGPQLTDRGFHATGVPAPVEVGTPGGPPAVDPGRWDGLPLVQANPFNAAGAFSDAPDGSLARIVQATRRSSDDYRSFRTPTLRNVGLTAPYMHAGQFATLREVVEFYSTLDGAIRFDHHGQTVLEPRNLSEDEITDLVAFLEALTGELPDMKWMRKRS
ncbi:MAG: cytochrome-c peroxidase [Phycisphaerales bacterium]